MSTGDIIASERLFPESDVYEAALMEACGIIPPLKGFVFISASIPGRRFACPGLRNFGLSGHTQWGGHFYLSKWDESPASSILSWLLLLTLVCQNTFAADSGSPPKPETTEVALSSSETEKCLAELAEKFKATPFIKARMVVEIDDLLGTRSEEGEMLLDHSGRILRKFTKPSLKIMLLNGAQLQEYSASRQTLYVKDFSKASKALKLLRAAATLDVKALEDLFDIQVLRGTHPKGERYCRFILTKKNSGDHPLLYKRIQARILENGLFFDEIEYQPESGDRVVERYLDIQAVPKLQDDDFTLKLPVDVHRKTEMIGEDSGTDVKKK